MFSTKKHTLTAWKYKFIILIMQRLLGETKDRLICFKNMMSIKIHVIITVDTRGGLHGLSSKEYCHYPHESLWISRRDLCRFQSANPSSVLSWAYYPALYYPSCVTAPLISRVQCLLHLLQSVVSCKCSFHSICGTHSPTPASQI